ncbi:hypothetical protein Leryth_004755 [Lithospermum erythrorhizon]|nr:hypothetical protein Leryth_004755 [Lithospermum erythrorhizon]
MQSGVQVTPESSIFEQIRDAQKGEIVGKGTQIAPEFSVSQQIRDVQKEEIVENSTQITSESSLSPQIRDAQQEEIVKMDRNLVVDEADGDDVDEDGEASVDVDVGSVAKSFSVPGFLRKVFTEELGNESGRDHKLLVIAVHAVLLDSELVAYDVVGRKEINGFPFRDEWPLDLFNLRLFYTLPKSMNLSSNNAYSIESVCLKFHSLGDCVTVYGSLVNGNKSAVYRVNFDEGKLVPFLNVVWANCGLNEEISFGVQGSGTNAEKEVFEFWRRVKDELALPMLIDLSEKYGFGLPACFMRLPTEIKLNILELLPGVDVARVGCACSELRYLSSSDELWKKKYAEQFGDAVNAGDEGHWKSKFVRYWETNRKRRRVVGRYSVGRMHPPRMPSIVGGVHDIWPHVQIIGGDYDRLPGLPLGGVLPMGRHHQASQVPRCNLGGSGQW